MPVPATAISTADTWPLLQVFAVDSIPERLAMASSIGADTLDVSGGSEGVVAAVRAATEGRGADVALEVVGASSALRLAFDVLRPMGTLSSVGVHTYSTFPWSPVEAYDKNIKFQAGRQV